MISLRLILIKAWLRSLQAHQIVLTEDQLDSYFGYIVQDFFFR